MAKLRLDAAVAIIGFSTAVVMAGPKMSDGKEYVGAQVPPPCNVYGGYQQYCEPSGTNPCRSTYSKCQSSVPGSNSFFCLPGQGAPACQANAYCAPTNADYITPNCTP